MDAMRKREAKSASLEELIDTYAKAAAEHGKATENGDYKTGNKAADTVAVIYNELRSRGLDAQRSLLNLLHDENPGIRIWAAAHALEFSPSDGVPVLETMIKSEEGIIRFDAEMTLKEWRNGKLRFP